MDKETCCAEFENFNEACDNKTNYCISVYKYSNNYSKAPYVFHYSDPHPMSEGYNDFTFYFKFCPFCGTEL